jgi:hypothetical protein
VHVRPAICGIGPSAKAGMAAVGDEDVDLVDSAASLASIAGGE